MGGLASKRCVPSRKGMASLTTAEAQALLAQLDDWQITDGPRLTRKWTFENFATALAFVNQIGEVAEADDHHPDITLAWGRVGVELWTHVAGGLTENDFIVAAKLDVARAAGPR